MCVSYSRFKSELIFYVKPSKCVEIIGVETRPLLTQEKMNEGNFCYWAKNFPHAGN